MCGWAGWTGLGWVGLRTTQGMSCVLWMQPSRTAPRFASSEICWWPPSRGILHRGSRRTAVDLERWPPYPPRCVGVAQDEWPKPLEPDSARPRARQPSNGARTVVRMLENAGEGRVLPTPPLRRPMAAIPWPAVSPFAPPELQDRHEDCRYLWNEKSRREEEMLPSGEPWCLGAIFLEGEEGEEEEEEEEEKKKKKRSSIGLACIMRPPAHIHIQKPRPITTSHVPHLPRPPPPPAPDICQLPFHIYE